MVSLNNSFKNKIHSLLLLNLNLKLSSKQKVKGRVVGIKTFKMNLPSYLQDLIVEQHPLLPGECHSGCPLHGVTEDTRRTFIVRFRQHPAFALKVDAK